MTGNAGPDIVVIMTDEEQAAPPYESAELTAWRSEVLTGERWFADNAVVFDRHTTGSLACVPSRPTIFTGQYPDTHGVTQTDGLGKRAWDSRMRWLRPWEVPTLGNWFRAAGYDTHYDGKWHISHADLREPGGGTLATNDDAGTVNEAAVSAYLEADPLAPYGFSGWVGPEPHGAPLANSGLRRDPLIAARVVAWLQDRYARRSAGDPEALRPFLLVASFVNPHDIVLFPLWQRSNPLEPSELDPPPVPEPPSAREDLSSKPAAQIAYRESYPTGYGPARLIRRMYGRNAADYRALYYRLHAEVDRHVERVRSAVVDGGSAETLLVRTSDHGELLGAHGGLHQKWFNLYDEAVRVPLAIARVGSRPSSAARVGEPTSHVDLVPTLLSAAGIDIERIAGDLADSFSEVHPLPGHDLMPVVDGEAQPDPRRAVYMVTRDNIMEGDTSASGVARRFGRGDDPPMPLRIEVPSHVGANFEGVIARVIDSDAAGGAGHLWKLVRTFDDPDTWTVPGVRHLAADAAGTEVHRSEALTDEWELYDLDADPAESHNLWDEPAAAAVFTHMAARLATERADNVRRRNNPWPYAMRRSSAHPKVPAPPPARLARRVLQRAGLHRGWDAERFDLRGRRALVVCTNHAVLGVGRPTGVFSSEMTVPYYAFSDAGMTVDLASPEGGPIPVDPLSLRAALRCGADDRMLADPDLRSALGESRAVEGLDVVDYDLIYLAGGWGAAFDLGASQALGDAMSAAYAAGRVIGGVCHGPLGLCRAVTSSGESLVSGRRITAVTDKQVRELGIDSTPLHPETELRRLGALFDCRHARRDVLANHWVTDGNLVTGQNQNAGPMVADEMMRLVFGRGSSSVALLS